MCVLILLRDLHPDFPIVAASNREEDPQRSTMPPGLKVLGGRRALCPQDRRYGGTWIGVNDQGLLAALTNAPGRSDPGALSRGLVTLEALAQANPREAVAAVRELVEREPARPFQLLVADADECRYCHNTSGRFEDELVTATALVMTNQLPPARCELRGLEAWALGTQLGQHDIEAVLDHLVVSLATGRGRDRETGATFPVCVREGERRTVSATLLAVPRVSAPGPIETLRLRYAAGNPLEAPFRNYDGLARRLRG